MPAVLRVSALLGVMALWPAPPAAAAGITKETLKIDRDSRTYYLFVPDSLGAEPAPLVITLHGSGRDGRPLVDLFRGVASRERFIVAGPDAVDRRGWQAPDDGPAFLYFLVEAIKAKHAVDGRRVYLFGHSAGAGFALTMGIVESEYFAGVAVHSAALQEGLADQLRTTPRKLPIAIFHGTRDAIIPIAIGKQTRDALVAAGFPVDFRELPGYEHNTLYTRGDSVVQPAWAFLKTQALEGEPKYKIYSD